jgi:DNA-binding protein HU-beta
VPLRRSDMIDEIAERASLTRHQAGAALSAFQDVLVTTLAAGEPVRLTGLMSVERVERSARTGRNPRTGEPIDIPAGFAIKLTAGSALKGAVGR